MQTTMGCWTPLLWLMQTALLQRQIPVAALTVAGQGQASFDVHVNTLGDGRGCVQQWFPWVLHPAELRAGGREEDTHHMSLGIPGRVTPFVIYTGIF